MGSRGQAVMIVECVKTVRGSNLGRCTLINDIEIRYSVWYWWEEQTSKHVRQWIYPLIVRTALIDWPESSQLVLFIFLYTVLYGFIIIGKDFNGNIFLIIHNYMKSAIFEKYLQFSKYLYDALTLYLNLIYEYHV